MKHPIYQVDAFTDRPFAGNPAGVMPLKTWLPDQVLQSIATEMSLAETAFFVPNEGGYHLRWFTPTHEVKLCGHATLASAFVLNRLIDPNITQMRFDSLSGPLHVRVDGDRFELDFPVLSHEANDDATAPARVAAAIGQQPVELLKSAVYGAFVARMKNVAAVRAAAPNFLAIEALGTDLIITADGVEEGVDFVSRFFAPLHGIPEDPVTGSSHCVLAPYWHKQTGKTRFHARQVSQRGGDLWLELVGDRVKIAGHGVLVLTGEINIP